ncbi:MAG: DUF3179 domain-containing protein [Bacteroidales bacterium]|nr:DUF3179 domain-containing protein [Bacteroidales bacterium]
MRNLLAKFSMLFIIANLLLSSCDTPKNKVQVTEKISFLVEDCNSIKNPRKISQKWGTDTTKQIIALTEFTALLSRNQIKPLNAPRYINTEQAKDSLFGGQPVIAIELNGYPLAFPINMLSYHEIVNDSIAGIPFTVAYCPLCNTAYIFDSRINHNNKEYTLKFGTSGMLRMSNLVMWDEQTETWWQHIDGEGLVGEMAGEKLKILPAKIISLNNYMEFYPQGKVMFPIEDTTYKTHYEINNYVHYDSIGSEKPFLFFNQVDPRLPAMEYIISIESDQIIKSFPLSTLQTEKVINNQVGSKDIVLFYHADMISNLDTKDISKGKQIGSGTVYSTIIENEKLHFEAINGRFKDTKTNSVWNFAGECVEGPYKGKKLTPIAYGLDFAFAWLAFHPESIIYTTE